MYARSQHGQWGGLLLTASLALGRPYGYNLLPRRSNTGLRFRDFWGLHISGESSAKLRFEKRKWSLWRPAVACLLAMCAGRFAALRAQLPPTRTPLQRARDEWFHKQRAYPLDHIPPGARLNALRSMHEMLPAASRQLSPRANIKTGVPPFSMTAWTSVGPQPTAPSASNPFSGYPTDAGRVTALAIDPNDATGNTIYLGAAEGGLWGTTDGGQSWTPLTDFQPSLAVGSIALDPSTSPTTIYVGTGEENFNGDAYFGAGVLKSTDGGKTWTQDVTFSLPADTSPSASGPYIGALAVNPSNNQILLAAVQSASDSSITPGIWRSTDGGHSWLVALPEPAPSGFVAASGAGTGVAFDPTSPTTAYAALGAIEGTGNNGIWKSIDVGLTWTQVLASSSPGALMGRVTLALGPPAASGKSSEILAAASDATACRTNSNACSTNLLGLFLSTDGASAWIRLATTPDFCGDPKDSTQGDCFYALTLAVSPTNPKLIYVGGANSLGGDTLSVSSDGGTTWSSDLYAGNGGTTVNTAGQLHTDTHVIVFSSDGTKLYVGNDGGIWETSDVGVSSHVRWNGLNNSLSLTQFYPGISVSSGNLHLALGGTQDNDTQMYLGNLQWQESGFCGDGAYTAISGSTQYIACAGDEGVWTSNPGGFRWAASGIGTCTTTVTSNCYHGDFVPPLVLDPAKSETLYFGTNVVYQTTDGATSWKSISPDLTNGDFQSLGTFITTINVAPVDSNVVYAGTADARVWITMNAGAGTSATFQEIDAGLPNRNVTQVVADLGSRTTAYAAFSGFSSCVSCDHLGHIFETKNNGQSWTNITGNLPDVPVNALVLDSAFPGTLYAATDIGVFSTNDGGATWSPLAAGMPLVAVLGLTMDAQTRTLWAGTHGRGMWALELKPPPDFSISASSLTSSVNPGSSATFAINVSPVGGPFTNPISLSCSGLPPLASCSFSPSSLTPGSGTATSTLTISTTAPSSGQVQRNPGDLPPGLWLWLASLLALWAATMAAKRSGKDMAAAFAFSALVLCLGAALIACSGRSHTQAQPGTPPGNYSVTVTGTSNQLQHSVTVPLSVI